MKVELLILSLRELLQGYQITIKVQWNPNFTKFDWTVSSLLALLSKLESLPLSILCKIESPRDLIKHQTFTSCYFFSDMAFFGMWQSWRIFLLFRGSLLSITQGFPTNFESIIFPTKLKLNLVLPATNQVKTMESFREVFRFWNSWTFGKFQDFLLVQQLKSRKEALKVTKLEEEKEWRRRRS